jgi:phosphate uptake regulator
MSEQVLDMFQRALTAFIQEDAQAARIAQEEERIDALYLQVYVEALTWWHILTICNVEIMCYA